MTRWLIRLAFPALGLLVALIVYGVKAPESAPDKPEEPRQSRSMPAFEELVPAPVASEGPDIVFKWQDDDGGWHYADQPPKEGPWYTLTIDSGQEAQPATADSPAPANEDLAAPYSAPFALDPHYPQNGS